MTDLSRTEVELGELDFLRRAVTVMRELGVTEYHGIVLDPAWVPPLPKPLKRSQREQDAITDTWHFYRTALENAIIDGPAAPEPPLEPEKLDE